MLRMRLIGAGSLVRIAEDFLHLMSVNFSWHGFENQVVAVVIDGGGDERCVKSKGSSESFIGRGGCFPYVTSWV